MTVSVDTNVARRNAVLVVPGRSVRDALSAKPWVLGLQGGSQTEIKAGLQAGDMIIAATSPIVDGTRVRGNVSAATP